MNERGSSRSDCFRFSLGLDAENASKDAAMSALNPWLAGARQVIQRLPWLGSRSLHPAATPLGEASFKLAEAPKSSQRLTLKLDYCLR